MLVLDGLDQECAEEFLLHRVGRGSELDEMADVPVPQGQSGDGIHDVLVRLAAVPGREPLQQGLAHNLVVVPDIGQDGSAVAGLVEDDSVVAANSGAGIDDTAA